MRYRPYAARQDVETSRWRRHVVLRRSVRLPVEWGIGSEEHRDGGSDAQCC
jgi:hypothetical protein